MIKQFKRLSWLTIIVFCLATAVASDSFGAGPVNWHSYAEGMAIGKSDGKKAMISFYADWCQYCKRMEQYTFRNPLVVAYLNENFIPIRVDVEKEKKIAAQYNINPLPDTWFISETGEVIGNKPGFMSAEELLPVLQFIHSESFLKMSYADFLENIEKGQ
ncbi:MAG: thioredoxin family protein [Deltaproteobacteria bacterium]|jgi:thioredoxin-related protein